MFSLLKDRTMVNQRITFPKLIIRLSNFQWFFPFPLVKSEGVVAMARAGQRFFTHNLDYKRNLM